MTEVLANLVRETSTMLTRDEDYVLNGAVTGFRTWADGVGDGNQGRYYATDGTDFEVGLGTVTVDGATTTISRDEIENSSNGGAAVSWWPPSSEKDIYHVASSGFLADNLPRLIKSDITVTVGSTGDFSTINAALEYLTARYPTYKSAGVKATISLQAGFVMEEQVYVYGLDLGWITITGVDSETDIPAYSLTDPLDNTGDYAAFGVCRGGTLPRIGQKFRMDFTGYNSRSGIYANGPGSSVLILDSCGVLDADEHGLYVIGGATARALEANFSGASASCIQAAQGGNISAAFAIASGGGICGVRAEGGAFIEALGVDATGAGSYGIRASDGSKICAQSAWAKKGETDDPDDCSVDQGSFIEFHGSSGGTSQAINTLTEDGIIFATPPS